jgi:tetraacyldisaccharide 4'-kinase
MPSILTYILYPASFLYACVMFFRNVFFDIGLFRTKKLSVPVISVGNVTTGGTGKTPAVGFIARKLQSESYKVGIISRGYKRSSHGYIAVSDGNRVLVDERQGGDEPVMLAHSLPGIAIAVDENRYRGSKQLIEDCGVDVIIMDDGFQHRTLHRDLDIVLINGSKIDQVRAHIPVGRLRERIQSLRRADLLIITKFDDENVLKSTEEYIHRYATVPYIRSVLKPEILVDFFRNVDVPIKSVVTKTAYLFSGIAQPDEFRKTANEAGFTVLGMRVFPDHYRFNERDVHTLLDEAKQSGANMLMTTEKDAIRMHPYKDLLSKNIPLYVLKVSFTMTHNDNMVLEKFLYGMMNKHKRSVTIN